MDQTAFNTLIVTACSTQDSVAFFSAIEEIYKLTLDCSIRDLSWDEAEQSDNCNVYNVVWVGLHRCWIQLIVRETPEWLLVEQALLKVWFYISTLPEYNSESAAAGTSLNQDFILKAFKRMVAIATTPQIVEGMEESLTMLKHLVHWLYGNVLCLRPIIRSQLGVNLIAAFPYHGNVGTSRSRSTNPATENKWVVQSSDAGNSRSHVSHLLELLLPVLSGLSSGDGSTVRQRRAVLSELLTEVLMPLHTPNEMIEWRDQIPVLQIYHEPLVRCLVKLVEKDRELTSIIGGNVGTSQTLSGGGSLLLQAINLLFKQWPESYKTNTPKQVLFLHELEILLELSSVFEFHSVLQPFLTRLVKCIGTDVDNIRPAQRALQYFKNEKFLKLLVGRAKTTTTAAAATDSKDSSGLNDSAAEERLQAAITDKVYRTVLPALYRGGKTSWNPTVNKMTALALKNIKELNVDVFKKYCDELFSPSVIQKSESKSAMGPPTSLPRHHNAVPLPSREIKRLKLNDDPTDASSDSVPMAEDKNAELAEDSKSSTGGDKTAVTGTTMPPPTGAAPSIRGGMPKLPPRAVNISSRPVLPKTGNSSAVATHWQGFSAANPPPVTITGVAPWAMGGASSASASATAAAPSAEPKLPPSFSGGGYSAGMGGRMGVVAKMPISRGAKELLDKHHQERDALVDAKIPSPIPETEADGFTLMSQYMELCYPQSEIDKLDLTKAEWNIAQAAASPTLLPSLKFHDLVFGQQLGDGAFSVVKYARHITKDKTQSSWPEYAVKIIMADKIRECQYLSSVVREMAVLQMLSHPGIARLISTFRYKDSAYLVLEYAAKGDLHTYLMTYGKLGHLHTRFIVGEVVAALTSIHEIGFCFNDLKPENVLISEIGHIKVGDFGACRPITQEARDLLMQSKSLLTNIRNGDWKESADGEEVQSGFSPLQEEEDQLFQDDDRLEGTPSYLPPEILMGRAALNNTLADAWAVGCLTSFCLEGKPLFFGEKEDVLDQIKEYRQRQVRQHHVHFQSTMEEGQDVRSFTELAQFESRCAQDFIDGLLRADPSERTPMSLLPQQDYLTMGYSTAHAALVADLGVPLPQRINPLTLHLDPPIKLPTVNKRQDGVDQQWARRQFSKLWAPMPSEYSMLDHDSASSGKLGEGHSMSDMWLQSHPHRLTVLEETGEESCCSFIVLQPSSPAAAGFAAGQTSSGKK